MQVTLLWRYLDTFHTEKIKSGSIFIIWTFFYSYKQKVGFDTLNLEINP